MLTSTHAGVTWLHSPLLDRYAELGHAFSTRAGGVSSGTHASLNLSSSTGDTSENARENRRRLCDGVGADVRRVTIPRQVLGAAVRPVDDAVLGRVTPEPADGLVTDRRGVPTLTLSADCVLVLLYDPVRRAIANVHSSRLGTVGEIAVRAVERLQADYATRPEDLVAAVGPSIGPCCYELREDAAGEWRARHGERHLAVRDSRTVLDLWGAVRGQLEGAGVRPANIDVAGVCTRCHPESFFSYRRDGARTGRFGALLWLRE